MYAITLYGREVVVRRRFWFGPFHCQLFEVCDASTGEQYTPIAAFSSVDEVWRYIAAEGHRIRNWKSWMLTTIDVYRQSREMNEYVVRQLVLMEERLFLPCAERNLLHGR